MYNLYMYIEINKKNNNTKNILIKQAFNFRVDNLGYKCS